VVAFTSSLYDFGGVTSITQWLELGVSVGFLTGTYLLAHQNPRGFFGFMVMNSSNAVLMTIQDKPLLAIQQIASLLFVVDACSQYRLRRAETEDNGS